MKINGSILLTKTQLKKLLKGRSLRVFREGKPIVIGLKQHKARELRIMNRINILQAKLEALRNGRVESTKQITAKLKAEDKVLKKRTYMRRWMREKRARLKKLARV